jgi:hypothetical protein
MENPYAEKSPIHTETGIRILVIDYTQNVGFPVASLCPLVQTLMYDIAPPVGKRSPSTLKSCLNIFSGAKL